MSEARDTADDQAETDVTARVAALVAQQAVKPVSSQQVAEPVVSPPAEAGQGRVSTSTSPSTAAPSASQRRSAQPLSVATSQTPYGNAPARAFWRRGVLAEGGLDTLYEPQVRISADTAIATIGSCFAQYLGPALRHAGLSVLEAEPAPVVMPRAAARHYGYGLTSVRCGNVYTARALRQFLDEIISGEVSERHVWEGAHGGYVDGIRPTVEPHGLTTIDEVLLHRDYHLEKTAQMLRRTEVLIFTLGLTEAWMDRGTGRVYPICPGTAGGRFDPGQHAFCQFRYPEIMEDLDAIFSALQRFNPGMQMILTVSPVPLTATATQDHVLTAATGAKATLRAAAGDFAADTSGVDYFPSFELITSHATGGPWFAANQREVAPEGVQMVMTRFLGAHGVDYVEPAAAAPGTDMAGSHSDDEVICEELLLEVAQ